MNYHSLCDLLSEDKKYHSPRELLCGSEDWIIIHNMNWYVKRILFHPPCHWVGFLSAVPGPVLCLCQPLVWRSTLAAAAERIPRPIELRDPSVNSGGNLPPRAEYRILHTAHALAIERRIQ